MMAEICCGDVVELHCEKGFKLHKYAGQCQHNFASQQGWVLFVLFFPNTSANTILCKQRQRLNATKVILLRQNQRELTQRNIYENANRPYK